MEVTPSDLLKGMKSPTIWGNYQEILNKAEGHEVDMV